MPHDLTDIIKGCLQHHPRAEDELYRRCYPEMIKVCLRYSSGDLQQAGALLNQGMLKVFQNLAKFRNEGHVLGWIRTVIVNTCIDQIRVHSVPFSDAFDTANEELVSVEPEVYSMLSSRELLDLVHSLRGNTKLVFNLFVFDGFRHEEIAEMVGISAGTSRWHLNEARRSLRQSIESILKKETLSHAI